MNIEIRHVTRPPRDPEDASLTFTLTARETQRMARPEYLQNTTLQRVLLIPELLDMVFSYLDASDNAVNARVCRRWCNIALDILWRDVEDMRRLFSLLAPLHLGNTSEYVNFSTKSITFVRLY